MLALDQLINMAGNPGAAVVVDVLDVHRRARILARSAWRSNQVALRRVPVPGRGGVRAMLPRSM